MNHKLLISLNFFFGQPLRASDPTLVLADDRNFGEAAVSDREMRERQTKEQFEGALTYLLAGLFLGSLGTWVLHWIMFGALAQTRDISGS